MVRWCRRRWNEDAEWRKKRIITSVQDMLEIAAELGDRDMAQFEAGTVIGEDKWFALQMSYFLLLCCLLWRNVLRRTLISFRGIESKILRTLRIR